MCNPRSVGRLVVQVDGWNSWNDLRLLCDQNPRLQVGEGEREDGSAVMGTSGWGGCFWAPFKGCFFFFFKPLLVTIAIVLTYYLYIYI